MILIRAKIWKLYILQCRMLNVVFNASNIIALHRYQTKKCLPISRIVNGFYKPSFSTFFPSESSKPYQDSDIIESDIGITPVEQLLWKIEIGKDGKSILNGQSLTSLKKCELEGIYEKFKLQGLTDQTLKKYELVISKDRNMLLFPLRDGTGAISSIHYVTVDQNNMYEEKLLQRKDKKVFFGWNIVTEGEDIIVTSSAFDAMIINQELNKSVIAVPFKEDSFSQEVLSLLGKFNRVVLWLDANFCNCYILKPFLDSLGSRVYLVRSQKNPGTPLHCFQSKEKLKEILDNVFPLKHDELEPFSLSYNALYSEINDEESYGTQWKRFHILNELMKGLRRGELTVFSGQTGTGKTTFMSEYSLDLCMQGVPTVWGSFETKKLHLMNIMLTQFSMCSLKGDPELYKHWATKFSKLPLFFMVFSKHYTVEKVIEVMTYAASIYKIGHVVIDNLQFMMNSIKSTSYADHLWKQDEIFSSFRHFASHYNCHVTLVMHPRKEPEFTELNNSSISGSAKATQEADNILILQATKSRQYLQVTKNRFVGKKGCVALDFDQETLTFSVRKIFSNKR